MLLPLLSLGTCLLTPTGTVASYVQPSAAEEAPEPTAYRADPLPTPGHALEHITAPVRATEAGVAQANVFFLNYDGVTLKLGGIDNSATNTTMFDGWNTTYQPYGNGAKRAASLQAVKSDWAKYDVLVTDVRPQSGLYTMCVNSPTNIYGGGVLGVAHLDCGDETAGANIVLAFHSDSDQFSAATQATTMSQEIAHAYGLEHVNAPNDIMNPYNAGGDPSFLDQCLNLDAGGGQILCNSQHNMFCGGGQQNSHKELMWLFGGSQPDPVPPTVEITFPKNGDQLAAPADIVITANASDNVGVAQVDLYIDGMNQNQPRFNAPYGWDAQFPEGTYCLTAEATDDEPNKTMSAEVCFSVVQMGGGTTTTSGGTTTGDATTGVPETSTTGQPGSGSGGESGTPDPTTSGAGTEDPPPESDSGDGTSSGGTSGVSPDSSALPPGFGGGDGDDGCACAQAPEQGATGLLLLAMVGLVGRRRRG